MAADAHSPGSPSQALADLHISLEVNPSPASSPPPMLNGFKAAVNGLHHTPGGQDGLDLVSKLQQELERTREQQVEAGCGMCTPNPWSCIKSHPCAHTLRKSSTDAGNKWLN